MKKYRSEIKKTQQFALYDRSNFRNDDDSTRYSFHEYYMALLQIKDLNELIANQPFLDQPVKHKQETYEKHVEI